MVFDKFEKKQGDSAPRDRVDANLEAEKFLIRQRQIEDWRAEWRGRGEEFELHLFGGMEGIDDSFRIAQKKIMGSRADFGKKLLPAQEETLLNLTKKYQPAHQTDYARNLRLAVAEALGLRDEREVRRLKFYTAVAKKGERTAVDVKLGTDAFFVFEELGRNYDLRIDATTNPDHPSKGIINADILVGPEHVPDSAKEPEAYKKEVQKTADLIAKKFLDKIERKRQEVVAPPSVSKQEREQSLVSAISQSRKGGNVREYTPPPKSPRSFVRKKKRF